MSSFAAFIRENPERARSIEQMTTYLPFLLTDGRSIVQSQAALTASRLASLIVSVCLHEHPAIQSHIVNLQRGLALSSTGTLPNPHGSSGDRLHEKENKTTTGTTSAQSRQQQGGDGGEEVESYHLQRSLSNQRVDDGLNDDHHADEDEKDKDSNVSSPSPTVSSLFSKYTDPTSRSLIAHYKGNVGAELVLLLLGEIEVLLEMSVRSMTLQRLLASHGLGSSLGGDAPHHGRRQSSIKKLQQNAVKADLLAESHAKNQPTGRITRFLSGKTTPLPSTAVLHRRSRRIGWIMCFTVSIIKAILRLYLQRTTLSAAVRSMLAHVQRVLTNIKGKGRRLLCFSEPQEEEANSSDDVGKAEKKNPKALAGCGVGRPVSGGLTIPRVAVEGTGFGGCWPQQGPTTAACDEHSAAKTVQESNSILNTRTNDDNDTYLFSVREYLATIIDTFHAAKPLLWTFVALVSRHPSSLRTMIKLRSGGAALSDEESSGASPLLSLFASVPPLYMPSWRGWLTMTSLELAAFGVSVWLKLSRRPVIIIGGVHATTSAAAGQSSLLLEPPMRISASAGVGRSADAGDVPTSASSETNNNNNNNNTNEGGVAMVGIVSRGIDAMPMTEEKDHERVRTCLYHLTRSLIQDPYFSVVLRDYVVRYMIDGGVSRIPLLGGIIGAQVMMFMLRRDASFLASNF